MHVRPLLPVSGAARSPVFLKWQQPAARKQRFEKVFIELRRLTEVTWVDSAGSGTVTVQPAAVDESRLLRAAAASVCCHG